MPADKNQFVIPSALLAAGIIIAAALGSYTFYSVRSFDNVLSVTGSAKTSVMSDSVKWTVTFTRKVTEAGISSGYALMDKDLKALEAFLTENGVTPDSRTVSLVALEEIYRYDQNQTGPREFNLRQNVIVNSNDVEGIDALSKRASELSAKGLLVTANWVEFYVTKLPELRVSLLGEAVKDARARAEQIASAGEQSVGALKAASSGVVQVLAPNSIDVSDYGQYDTLSIEKDVLVTVRATFFVR